MPHPKNSNPNFDDSPDDLNIRKIKKRLVEMAENARPQLTEEQFLRSGLTYFLLPNWIYYSDDISFEAKAIYSIIKLSPHLKKNLHKKKTKDRLAFLSMFSLKEIEKCLKELKKEGIIK